MTEQNHNIALERMRATGNWGDEPSCPACGNGNAVLHVPQHELPADAVTEHACRDCKHPLTQDELEHQRMLVFNRTVKLYWPELV